MEENEENNSGNNFGISKNTVIGAIVAIILGMFTSYCAPVTIHFINKALETPAAVEPVAPAEEPAVEEEAPAEEEETPVIAGLCYTDIPDNDPGCPAMPGKNYCDPEEWVCKDPEEETQ